MAELEKNLLDNKKLESEALKDGENDEEKIKENEEENRKFKEYREQQLKHNEEMEEKLKKLEEEKLKEEESLKNDVNKLQAKIKELNSEIDDLRLDNARDRTDYNEEVKSIYRNNQFYREIIRYMLSDSELKQIVDMSKYLEEEEKWEVQNFSLREKSLALPTMKLGLPGMRKNSIKQVIFQNYDNTYQNNDMGGENTNLINIENNTKASKDHLNFLQKGRDKNKKMSNRKLKEYVVGNSGSLSNLKEYDDKLNDRINLRISNDKIVLDGRRQSKSHIPPLRNPIANQKVFSNPNDEERNNINKILMNQKEREKFEMLSNNNKNKNLLNPLYGSASNPIQMFNKGGNKYGKIQLNPLASNNNVFNKIESGNNNLMPPMPLLGNKKYKLGQIQEKEDF